MFFVERVSCSTFSLPIGITYTYWKDVPTVPPAKSSENPHVSVCRDFVENFVQPHGHTDAQPTDLYVFL